jgi:hypothetical protein
MNTTKKTTRQVLVMKRILASLLIGFGITAPSLSAAAVNLLDKDDWKVQMSGFVEMDMFRDSKRSFTEGVGNGAVSRSGTFEGENGRMQTSIRNSRLAFSVLPPQQVEWKTKGYLELDLMGYDPSPSPTTQSESSFSTNATMRVRHAYFNGENDGWLILAGQYWTLFGWSPTYVLTTASVPPGPGIIYQRTSQLTGMKTLAFGENKVQIGLSIARPSQRDSSVPNFDAGVKYSYLGWTSGFASPSGDVKAEPLSVAVSTTMRQFATPTSNAAAPAVTEGLTKTNGSAFALDAMLPVLPSSDGKDVNNTITVTGEYSAGKGYGDSFPGWTGGLPQYPNGTTGAASKTNLDAGQGSWDSNGTFQLIKLQTWNAQVQYHLPNAIGFITLGHGELTAKGIDGLSPALTYDKAKMDFVNFFHDFTPQIRGAFEYAKFTTHYVVQNDEMKDDRFGLTAYFRF